MAAGRAAPASGADETRSQHDGGCLCGGVRYRLTGALPGFEVCHCRQCQRAQGGAFVVVAPVASRDFTLLAGATLLTAYRSSGNKERVFCARCGSPLYSRRDDRPDRLRLRVGTLDDSSGAEVVSHAHVASRVDWCDISDTAPSYDGPRPGP